MLKRILSYFFPVVIYQRKSALSKNLEVTWNNGQLVLDSKNTNYSYGSLQRALRKGLRHIGFDTIKSMESVLVLGVAGGSVIKTLVDEIQFTGKITGVEIDPEITQIANEYFSLDKIPNLLMVIDDAFEFVLRSKKHYDLIIIDIFQDTLMPNFLFEEFFISRTGLLLTEKGFILFNTMVLNQEQIIRNEKYCVNFRKHGFYVQRLPRFEKHNELLIIQNKKAAIN